MIYKLNSNNKSSFESTFNEILRTINFYPTWIVRHLIAYPKGHHITIENGSVSSKDLPENVKDKADIFSTVLPSTFTMSILYEEGYKTFTPYCIGSNFDEVFSVPGEKLIVDLMKEVLANKYNVDNNSIDPLFKVKHPNIEDLVEVINTDNFIYPETLKLCLEKYVSILNTTKKQGKSNSSFLIRPYGSTVHNNVVLLY